MYKLVREPRPWMPKGQEYLTGASYKPTGCTKNALSVSIDRRAEYKDGTCRWAIYLSIPGSRTFITLDYIRGTLVDAEKRAAELLGLEYKEPAIQPDGDQI